MERPTGWDLAAAARVSSRVEFREIRLSELSASSPVKIVGMLEPPQVEHQCAAVKNDDGVVEILCSYHVRGASDVDEPLKADLKYLISYTLLGDEPVDPVDLEQFAFANGTYHSWPFVRQLLFDLTARMGYPPYNLPVFKFFPKRAKTVEAIPPSSAETLDAENEATPSETTAQV